MATRPSAASLLEPVVERLSRRIGGSVWSRRSFLVRSTVVGSAVALAPRRFVLEPHSAYGAVCGTDSGCFDGFTAFCCTISRGANVCPEGSFIGGWWKADGSAFCRGAPRYYIDCNGARGSDWQCHCSDSPTCDQRHVACAQFRYGNCSLDVPFYAFSSPVVCRVVICTPPWEYDPACTTTTMVDERTVSHSAPCLPGPWPSPIVMKWSDLGGPGGPLGPEAGPVSRLPHGEGHVGTFRNAAIFDVAWLGIRVVGPDVWPGYRGQIGPDGIGYPLTDQEPLVEPGAWFQLFGRRAARGRVVIDGAVYSSPEFGPGLITQPIYAKYWALRAQRGPMGFPTGNVAPTSDGTSTHVRFARVEHGRIVSRGAIVANPTVGTFSVHGLVYSKWHELGAEAGVLGYPSTDERRATGPGCVFNEFASVKSGSVASRGAIYATPRIGVFSVRGLVFSKWHQAGAERGALGYPASDEVATPDGQGVMNRFVPLDGPSATTGGTVVSFAGGTWVLLGTISVTWLDDQAGVRHLGLPIGDEASTAVGSLSVRSQSFQTGMVYDSALARGCVLYGPILTSYTAAAGPEGALGAPLTSVVQLGAGVVQVTFQGGTLTYTPGIGVT